MEKPSLSDDKDPSSEEQQIRDFWSTAFEPEFPEDLEENAALPERMLWAHAIHDSLLIILRGTKYKARREEYWLFVEEAPERVGSFRWITNHLQLDGDALRERILLRWPEIQKKSKRKRALLLAWH